MNPDQERSHLRGQCDQIMAEVSAFGIAAADPLNAVRLLIARCDDLEQRNTPTAAGVTAAEIESMARALVETSERLALAKEIADDLADEKSEPETWLDVDERDREEILTLMRRLVEDGHFLPGQRARQTPTTAQVVVTDPLGDATAESLLRASRWKSEQLRTAVIAARTLAQLTSKHCAEVDVTDPEIAHALGADLVAKTIGLGEAARRWSGRYAALADPPMEIEVEDDDDPDGTPVEGALWVKEEGD